MRARGPIALLLLATACGGAERPRGARDAGARAPSPDAGASAPLLRLSVRVYTRPWLVEGATPPGGQGWVYLEADVVNPGDDALPVDWRDFALATNAAVHPASAVTERLRGRCEGDVDGHARRLCPLYFLVEAGATLSQLVLHTDRGDVRADLTVVAGPPALCPVPGPELDEVACRDGCNNDGDGYVDCDDADCCAVRADCPPGTYCGGPEIECVEGVEGTILGCKDTCDNDADGYVDCDDFECCDLRACGPDSSCGQRPDPFEGPIFFDDRRVEGLDPSLLLAGPAPCRAPALVRVRFVRDGDTFDVEPLDGSGVEGSVRLIGADTPEIGRDGAQSECYAREAADWALALTGRSLWLTFDAQCRDRFDRHLAYAHFGGQRTDIVQRHLLRRGLARRLAFEGNDGLHDLLDNDAALAEQAGVGLWTACP